MSCIRLLLLTLLLASQSALATGDYDTIFNEAIDSVDFGFAADWAYTETRVGDEHVWVGRFDPRRPAGERWQLLSVDDRAPSAEELAQYRKHKAHEHSGDGENEVTAMVEPDSLRLVEETDDYWLLGFTPGDDEEGLADSVEATIRIGKPGAQLEYIDLRNFRPVRPSMGVKLSRLVTRLTFGRATNDGPIVMLSTQVDVKGRAFLVISFDEQELTRNSDFVFVGEQ